jgi:hypothetical protein
MAAVGQISKLVTRAVHSRRLRRRPSEASPCAGAGAHRDWRANGDVPPQDQRSVATRAATRRTVGTWSRSQFADRRSGSLRRGMAEVPETVRSSDGCSLTRSSATFSSERDWRRRRSARCWSRFRAGLACCCLSVRYMRLCPALSGIVPDESSPNPLIRYPWQRRARRRNRFTREESSAVNEIS